VTITLYELAGANPDLRFSPYCWRTRLALAHKGLAAEGVPWRFTETDKIAFSGQGKVPVLVDGGKVVSDSWAIAEYLEDTYPERPGLFGPGGRAHVRFLNAWADTIVHPGIARLVVRDIIDVLRPEDIPYFRHSRERAFGRPLEDVVTDRDARVEDLRRLLAPVRTMLKAQPWLGGAAPDYADYILLGSLMWPRCTSAFTILEADDPVALWQARGMALFDGMLARAPTCQGGARSDKG
jgi:glutathione S-transferase